MNSSSFPLKCLIPIFIFFVAFVSLFTSETSFSIPRLEQPKIQIYADNETQNPFEYKDDVKGYRDLLDIRLTDIIQKAKQYGEMFARLVLFLETRPEIDSSLLFNFTEVHQNTTQILLLGTWSSGSTFLTKLLTHYPGVFLHFEPLVYIKGYGAVEPRDSKRAAEIIRDLIVCNYSAGSYGLKYLRWLKTSGYKAWPLHNIRLKNVCEGLEVQNRLCFEADYNQRICKLHPIQLVKTVRLRVKDVESLLQSQKDEGPKGHLNIKVLSLFRDPRAVRSSRLARGWCGFPACSTLKRQCGDHIMDMNDSLRLAAQFPNQVLPVKYEELATRPKVVIPKMLQFLGLSWQPALSKFMTDHMVDDPKHNKESDMHTQSVNSEEMIDKWKKKMKKEEREKVERECKTAIQTHEEFTML